MAVLDKDLPIISSEEWEFLKEIVKVLKPLEPVTPYMSGQNYVTASSVIVLTDGLYESYRELKKDNSLTALSKDVIDCILQGIQSRLGNLEKSNSLLVTTFLYTRFKNVGGKNVEGVIWKSFDKKKKSISHSGGTPYSKAIIEIQRYPVEPLIPRQEDPVRWWKNNSYSFPYLRELVQEKCITIATSVPCDRQFSKSGQIVSDRRSRLSSTRVKQILFITSNRNTK
nr:unnamed protein product [Callosobruchus analis]